jgi:ribose transport system ATP-binding protein
MESDRHNHRLEVEAASKTFGPARVLDSVGLRVAPGEIHALIGQNGSGKSTLIKMLSGFHPADPGTRFFVNGTALGPPVRERALKALGLSFVHQDLGLVDTESVLDNVRIGQFTVRRLSRRIRRDAERDAVAATFERLRVSIHPDALVAGLSAGQRAVVAIARALQTHTPGQGCIVFDESTQALSRPVLHEFWEILHDLAADGTSILLVSHRLGEVVAHADKVTVLRDGKVTGAGLPVRETTESELTRLMLGRDVAIKPRAAAAALAGGEALAGPVALSATGLSVGGKDGGRGLHGLDLRLRGGEVTGITGPADSGYEDVPYLLAAARPGAHGVVEIGGQAHDLTSATPAEMIRAGMALVPQDRAKAGLALGLTLLENLTVPRVPERAPWYWLSGRWQREDLSRVAAELGITPSLPDLPAGALSGGNQQRLMLGKCLLGKPAVLVAHEPTQAVDVGARADLLHVLRSLADSGAAVLIASAEAGELAAICDRVIIVGAGRRVAELTGTLTAEEILARSYTGKTSEEVV